MNARAANDRIARQAERLRFVSRVPMVCDCGKARCRTIVMISLDDYHDLRRDSANVLTAPGHRINGADAEDERQDYAIVHRRRGTAATGRRVASSRGRRKRAP